MIESSDTPRQQERDSNETGQCITRILCRARFHGKYRANFEEIRGTKRNRIALRGEASIAEAKRG